MQIRSTNIEARNNFQIQISKCLKNWNFRFWSLFRISDFEFRVSSRAFTLIEMLVVISIIGTLMAIGVVGWTSVAQRGRDSTRKTDLVRIKQVLQQQYTDTRTFPVFEKISGQKQIFAATWQLTKNGGDSTGCSRVDSANKLAPRYIDKIPTDPKDNFDYAGVIECKNLFQNQNKRYLYISSPTTSAGPSGPVTGWGLMATLETSQADRLIDSLNPLKNGSDTSFGPWYAPSGVNNYGRPINMTANLLIDNKN